MGNLQVRFLEGWAPAMAPGYSTLTGLWKGCPQLGRNPERRRWAGLHNAFAQAKCGQVKQPCASVSGHRVRNRYNVWRKKTLTLKRKGCEAL
jgi:hypothetical protein